MTVLRSDDLGKSWPRGMVVYPGPAAYSSLCSLNNDSAIGLAYERQWSDGTVWQRPASPRPLVEAEPTRSAGGNGSTSQAVVTPV